MSKISAVASSIAKLAAPKNVVKVHPFDKGAKGDVQSADITLNGESIGQIERNWDIVWVGGYG